MILKRFDSRQQPEFLAMLRLDRREKAAVGREDAADLQPFGDGDKGGIDEADVCVVIFFEKLGDTGQVLRG